MRNKQPTHEIKLGRIRATIWANMSDDDELWFNVTLTRFYKAGNKWKEASSFGRDDLPVASKALDLAHGWILDVQLKKERLCQEENGQVAQDAGE